jgi:hypothetical protein
MTYKNIITTIIIAIAGASSVQSMQAFHLTRAATATKAVISPLFGKPIFTTKYTTDQIAAAILARKGFAIAGAVVGGICWLTALNELTKSGPRRPGAPDPKVLFACGLIIPTYTYLIAHMIFMPLVGTFTMLAGE